MSRCSRKSTGAYGTRYLKRAEALATSVRARTGSKKQMIDGCIIEGGKVLGKKKASSIELPARIALFPVGFIPYHPKGPGSYISGLLHPLSRGFDTARSLYDPMSPAGDVAWTTSSISGGATNLFYNYTLHRLGVQVANELTPVPSISGFATGEKNMISPRGVAKHRHFNYHAQVLANVADKEQLWLAVTRTDAYGRNVELFSISGDHLSSVTGGYKWYWESVARSSSVRVMEINETNFVVVFVARKVLHTLPNEAGFFADDKAILWRVSLDEKNQDGTPNIRSTITEMPESIIPAPMRTTVDYSAGNGPLGVTPSSMRVDDMELDHNGNVLVAMKISGYVSPLDQLQDEHKLIAAISFGVATWGNLGGGSLPPSYTQHSIEVDSTDPDLVAAYGYSPEIIMMGDRQIMINGDVYRWGVTGKRKQQGVDVLLPTSVRPYIVELKNGVPTGMTGEDEGTALCAFGVAMEYDDLSSEIAFFDRDYNHSSGVQALRNRFVMSGRDFARNSMCGEKAYVSDTCVAFPAGGAMIAFGESPILPNDTVESLSFRSDGAGLTFIDGGKRKYERICDTADFSPYGSLGEDLTNSIAFQNNYIMYVDCFQQEVRDDDASLIYPSGLLISIMQERPKDGSLPRARIFVRCGPIWPEDMPETGEPAPVESYYREVTEVGAAEPLPGELLGIRLRTGMNSKALFQGWPFPLRDFNHLFMAG